MKFKFDSLQQLGRALMLPIALLPIAGLLLRFGQSDLLNIKYIADAGSVIFTNLPILFALGVAVGLAKDNNGTAALASAVGYFIMTTILSSINKDINTGVLGGILIGWIAALIYNRFKDIALPEFLAFFGGKRFVPILTGLSAVFIGIALGHIWPPIQNGLNIFGIWLINAGGFGLFIYGVLNRLLLIAGLHHVINNLVWFVFGSYTNASGVVSHGDIARFMAGDKTAGSFLAGFFPIMMFGLPGACLAMYKNALTDNKKAVAGLLLSIALTSFLTGVTEPIEYSFIFLAPILFVIHSVLTGISLAVMYYFKVHLGFTFSAGLIDYILFFKQGTNSSYLIPIGLVFFAIYYFTFDFFIRKMNLLTIGREPAEKTKIINTDNLPRAIEFIDALGGSSNLISVDACTTRLRLTVKDSTNIKREKLKTLGTMGILSPTTESLQIILGPIADIVASEIKDQLLLVNEQLDSKIQQNQNIEPDTTNRFTETNEFSDNIAKDIIINLGGKSNIKIAKLIALTRIRFEIDEENLIDNQFFSESEILSLISIDNTIKHIYIGEHAQVVFSSIERILLV